MSICESTGSRGWTSPPKMYTVLSMTERTCEERRRRSAECRRVHLPLRCQMALLMGMVRC